MAALRLYRTFFGTVGRPTPTLLYEAVYEWFILPLTISLCVVPTRRAPRTGLSLHGVGVFAPLSRRVEGIDRFFHPLHFFRGLQKRGTR